MRIFNAGLIALFLTLSIIGCDCPSESCKDYQVNAIENLHVDSISSVDSQNMYFAFETKYKETTLNYKKKKRIIPCYRKLSLCVRHLTWIPLDSIFIRCNQNLPGFPANSLLNKAPFIFLDKNSRDGNQSLSYMTLAISGFSKNEYKTLPTSANLEITFKLNTGPEIKKFQTIYFK